MNTIQEVKEAYDSLNSDEGTLQFMTQHTYLTKERVEGIYRLGSPWPMWEDTPEWAYVIAILKGESTVEGVSPKVALNALATLRQLDIESNELAWPKEVMDHVEDVARLSGEESEVIQDVFKAEILRLQRMLQMIEQVASLKPQGREA